MANEIHIELDLVVNDTLIHLDGNKDVTGYQLNAKTDPKNLVKSFFDEQFHNNPFLNILPDTAEYNYVSKKTDDKKSSEHTITSKYGENEVIVIKSDTFTSFKFKYVNLIDINKILDSIPFISQILTIESTIKSIEVLYLHVNNDSKLDEKDIKTILSDTASAVKNLNQELNIVIRYGDLKDTNDYYYLIGAEGKGKEKDKDKKEDKIEGKNNNNLAPQTEKKKKPVPFKTSIALKGELKKMNLVLNPEFDIAGLSVKLIDLAFTASSGDKGLEFNFIPTLNGIEIGFENKVFSVQGALYHNKNEKDKTEEYNGSLIVKSAKFEMVLFGSYIKMQDYSSIFAFGYLGIQIPLHPAFNIKGLAAGFGMHRMFTAPKISEINSFPLIEVMEKGKITDTPKEFFNKLNKYFAPKKDSLVIIAGLKFNSFNIMDTIAIAIVVLEENPTINLVGLTSISSKSSSNYKPYHLELGFVVSIDSNKGQFLAYGQLTDNSYILLPKLKLTGGFAFAIWFKNQENISAGDFVATIGGYHPKFKAPEHYPTEIPRLGFDFKDEGIHFYGMAYFAITPSCMMAGLVLGLYTEFNYGIVEGNVTIKLTADFIIGWAPFYYEAEMSANIHVVARVLFFKLTLDIYAQLNIAGPEFGGNAIFKVKGHEVQIDFGNQNKEEKLLTFDKFKNKYYPENDKDKILTYNITSGVIKKFKDKSGQEQIVVNPKTFALEINSEIPITKIDLGDSKKEYENTRDIYPVYNDALKLENSLYLKVNDAKKDFTSFESPTIIKKSLPKAIWNNTNSISEKDKLSNDNLLKDICTGVRLEFKKIESKINPVTVFLYDTLVKEYNHNGSEIINPKIEGSSIYNKETMKSFGILTEEEIDYTDLNNTEVYKYKEQFLGKYNIS